MGELPEDGIPYETIVITENGHINAAALSATRKSGRIFLRSFKGSNTYENVRKGGVFSVNYIPYEKKELFIKAATEGWGDEKREFEGEITMEQGFPAMKSAKGTAICRVESIREEEIEDEIGKNEVLHVDARILMWKGSAEGTIKVGEDRNIMALVAYTRYLISEGDVREKFRGRALELADMDDVVGRWVVEHL